MIATATSTALPFLGRHSSELSEAPDVRALSFSSDGTKGDGGGEELPAAVVSDSDSDDGSEASSLVLSRALKSGTRESHAAAENVHFVRNFVRGEIDRDLYADMVAGLYHTYVALEALLDRHAPAAFPAVHFPRELGRAEALREDMEYWHGPGWEARAECRSPSPAVRDYVDRLEEVARIEPLLLLSHAYTRYLGDLSGGKVLCRIARRALHLSRGHDGLQFYNFDRIKSAKLFKDEYRRAMDGLALEPDQVGRVVAEANVSFAMSMRAFEELDVKGGAAGSTVRPVGEALAYYHAEVAEQERGRARDRRPSASPDAEEETCPFGFKGGSSPHDAPPREAPEREGGRTVSARGGGRCPWPFVFFHDPATGMRDWQTWCAVGLVVCSCWSRAGGGVQ